MQPAGPDILIRGAGPAGCALALALRGSRHSVVLVDRRSASAMRDGPRPAFRPIALSYASRLILERLDAWRGLPVSPIETVQVSQRGRFGRTQLTARDAGVPALGYVVDYGALLEGLRRRLTTPIAEHEPQAAGCVVHAEGAAADAGRPYGQHAVVANVRFSKRAGTTAHERFTPEGPLALLPFDGRYAIVWSMSPARAEALAASAPNVFLRALAEAAGGALGWPEELAERSVHPLSLRVRRTRVAPREAFIGNAAQMLHPVAGQGLNLALRDAWTLAEVLREARDPGDAAVLGRYARARRADATATVGITDLLAQVFVARGPLVGAARSLALAGLEVLPPARRFFARRMIYGPSAFP